jgi:predicted O-linked N-acetylglucosamine transferase (SPINDLY family)
MDYLFSDPVTCPYEVRHLFAEKVVDLPCAITIEPLPEPLPPSDPPVLSNGYITFGAFNRVTKMTEEVVALWARILHAVPQSRLLLKHHGFDLPTLRTRMAERLGNLGIAADRVLILGSTTRSQHLVAFKDVDISLDTFPHNGGISTFESLQLGVPTVAMLGKTPASRVGGAILCALGLTDWVSQDAEGYLACAVKYAAMPDYLKTLRYELPTILSSSPAGNDVMYTRAVETAYRKMWINYCQTAHESLPSV